MKKGETTRGTILLGRNPPVQKALQEASRHTFKSRFVNPMKVGLPVVPLVEYTLFTFLLGDAIWVPHGGEAIWLSRSSDFSVKGSLARSSRLLISLKVTPAPLNFF